MSTQVAELETSQSLASRSVIPLLDTAKFDQMAKVAHVLSTSLVMPEHLRGVKRGGTFTPFSKEQVEANAFLIVNQAVRWSVDPFALAAETYVVGGKLGYSGKLVAAVVNSRSGIVSNLFPTYSGEGMNRTVTIHGKFPSDTQPRTITLSVQQAKTDHQMWTKDPDQKLYYSGVTKWARRHAPETILGVMTDDDLEQMRANEVHSDPVRLVSSQSLSDALADRLAIPVREEPTQQPAIEAESPPVSTPQAPAETQPKTLTQGYWKDRLAKAKTVDEFTDIDADAASMELPDALKSWVATQVAVARKALK